VRLVFERNDQIDFFRQVKEKSGLRRSVLGKLVGVVGRSYSDWANGRIIPKEIGVRFLSLKFGVPIPKIIETREEWWSGRVNGRRAALIGYEKFGVPGSLESRKRGGVISQQRRRERPEYYRNLGCLVANSYRSPKKSSELAEFVGIVLGDGGLTKDQCQITLSYEDDRDYAIYVGNLVDRLFKVKPGIFEYPKYGCRRVIISGVNFVKIMTEFGLKIGNKVINQIGIPNWVRDNRRYYCSCVRGLFDTDGGTFTHEHWVGKYKYRHFGLTFTSASKPLLDNFRFYLDSEKIKNSIGGKNIFIYDISCVKQFFKVVQPNNFKHIRRLEKHLSSPTRLV